MLIKPTSLAAAALLTLAAATGHAESFANSASSAGSSASSAGSASLRGSSDSSSGKTQVSDGDYRVIQVAELGDRPGMLRLTLRAADASAERPDELMLDLPRQAFGERVLGAGDMVNARNRPYGIEFARAASATQAREPFFLVLADDWHREIDPHKL